MKKILIVEDDTRMARALAIRLQGCGYQVALAADALTGIRMAVETRPHLILLDITMPGGGGLGVADRLQANADTAGIPIIFMTGNTLPELKQHALNLGAAGYFEKPFETGALIAAIQDVLGETVAQVSEAP